MTTAARPAPIALDPELAAFIQGGGISMHAASRNAELVGNLTRGLGCRVSPERTRVTVFVLASQCGAVLADFRANRAIAVVFTMPHTHRTVQLKGEDAVVQPLADSDHGLIARSREAFEAELTSMGYHGSLGRLLLAGAGGDVVAIEFTVTAAFIQTPGPQAGAPLPP